MFTLITIDPNPEALELISAADNENKPDAIFENGKIQSYFVDVVPEELLCKDDGLNQVVKDITGIEYDNNIMKVTLDKCQKVNTYLSFRASEEYAQDGKYEYRYGVEGKDSKGVGFCLDYKYGTVKGTFEDAFEAIKEEFKEFDARFTAGKEVL